MQKNSRRLLEGIYDRKSDHELSQQTSCINLTWAHEVWVDVELLCPSEQESALVCERAKFIHNTAAVKNPTQARKS